MENQGRGKFAARRKYYPIIAAIVLILTAASLLLYRIVSDRLIAINVSSMEELASHDNKAIINSLTERWNDMSAIVEDIRYQEYTSFEDMLSMLAFGDDFVDCRVLALTGDDGRVYRSTGVIGMGNDKRLYQEVTSHEDRFAVRFDYTGGSNYEANREYILIGLPIEPFTVSGVTFDHIFALTSIRSIENELVVESYGGKGTAYIIDENGYYVVNKNRSGNFMTRNNYFHDIADFTIEGFDSANALKETITDGAESISFALISENERYITVIQKMSYSSWYYVSSVPYAVFQEQAGQILRTFALVAAILILVVFMFMLLVFREQQKKIRTAMRHRDELAEAYALAKQANRAKTTFLNNMSHDIRTPMNAVIGFAALASMHIDDKTAVRAYLEKISRSSEHLLSLINDVLDMSRIEAGKIHLNEKPENLSEILHSIRDMFQSDVRARQMNFLMDTCDVVQEDIVCDKLRLNQILLNVVSNAIKYTPAGGTVSVRVIQKTVGKSGSARYEFRVKDNGIGMSEEFVKKMFDPFTREENTTVSGVQGTGLGLAITSNIVQMMGGSIDVLSEQHKGTEIIITLEFALAEETPKVGSIDKFEGLRGLVVDDDLNACQSSSGLLRTAGMRSEWCTSGKEAVVRCGEAVRIGDPFSLCIIDLQMPDMNGIETTREIRKVVGAEVPIVILTAYDWEEIEEEARAAGVTRFVNKPLFPSDLYQILLELSGEIETAAKKNSLKEQTFEGKRILIAEDNELNREIACELLSEAGFVTETAENGQICVDMLETAAPGYYDLILMDIQMPVMDGYQAAGAIRGLADPAKAGIPILALSANTFEEDKRAAREAGMNGHIAKPIQIPVLMEELRIIFDGEDEA